MKHPLPSVGRPVVVGVLVALALAVVNGGGARTAAATTSEPSRVSFRRDVAPVLAESCSTSSCHGGGSRPPVFDARGDVAKMRAALVGVASEERPDHAYVTPGVPQASYLVQKIDERLDDAECADDDCGAPMPLDNPSLSASARAKIRTWIAQGARDN